MFKRNILEKIKGYDEQQRYAEDVNFYLKLSEFFSIFILDESLVVTGNGKRSFGSSGLSANLRDMKKGFSKNLKDMYLARRLTLIEYELYQVFYQLKYRVLVIRNWYLRQKSY